MHIKHRAKGHEILVTSDKAVRPQSEVRNCVLSVRAECTLPIITQKISLIHLNLVPFTKAQYSLAKEVGRMEGSKK